MAGATTNNVIILDPSNDGQAKVLNTIPTGTEDGVVTRPILDTPIDVSLSNFPFANLDSFGRIRVSTVFTIFDSKQINDAQSLTWDTFTQNGATSTHSTINAQSLMQVAALASSIAIRQTKMRFSYQPGKSSLIYMSFYAPTEVDIVKRVGLFTGSSISPYLAPQDGIFLENDAGTITFNIAKNGTVTETVAQASWNIDPMDGTGPSGDTLNLNTGQVVVIDYQWLGTGSVRVGFVLGQDIVYVHEFFHSNTVPFTTVYMTNSNLTLRYTIHNTAATASVDGLAHICTSVISEAGDDPTGSTTAIDRGTTSLALPAAGTTLALLIIRLKTGYENAIIKPTNYSVMPSSTNIVRASLVINPTIAGALVYTGITNSAIEYAVGGVLNTVTGGLQLETSYTLQNNTLPLSLTNDLRLGASIAGVRDILVVTGERTGGATSVLASLTWRESI
jgi:hypothetical protein